MGREQAVKRAALADAVNGIMDERTQILLQRVQPALALQNQVNELQSQMLEVRAHVGLSGVRQRPWWLQRLWSAVREFFTYEGVW